MSSKNQPKNKTEKSLNALVLIMIVLSFAVFGSFVYESNKISNQISGHQITGQATGLEGVSGF